MLEKGIKKGYFSCVIYQLRQTERFKYIGILYILSPLFPQKSQDV